MNNQKRNSALTVIGIVLIIVGIIVFIVASVQLYNVQTTESRWIEGFMQDYQARTNAENSIPCYIFMALSVIMVIAGIVMIAIRPKNVKVEQNSYVGMNNSYSVPYANKVIKYCTKCGNPVNDSSSFCGYCGNKII